MKQIVIMPGGFHPFHAGHYALYQSAKQAFPDAEVFVAATNDTSERPFPFTLKEKLATLAGVEPGHFIQVKSPFQAKEITQNFNPDEDVVIFVRSEKDRKENPQPGGTKKDGSPAYFQPWTGKDVQPFAKHAYFEYLPTIEFGPGITSATEIRKAWPTLSDKHKLAMVMSLYPATQKNLKLAKNVSDMFDQVMISQVKESLQWSDFGKGMTIDDKLNVIEAYYSDKTHQLLESNDPDMHEYFLSLQRMSSTLVKNSEYLIVFLALMNNKVYQLERPTVVKLLSKRGEVYTVELPDGSTTDYPSKTTRETLVAATFLFNNSNDFNKFNTALALKFNFNLGNYNEYVLTENEDIATDIDFKRNLLTILQQKYPDVEFKLSSDRVESKDGKLIVIADTTEEDEYVGVFMWDVVTGPYKGALVQAVKNTTDQLLQANPEKKPALFIGGDNQNPEAWEHIANKLKYKLITDEDNVLEENAIKNIKHLVNKITPMLGEASIQQKAQFVKLLENAKQLMVESANKKTIVTENTDYLEEK